MQPGYIRWASNSLYAGGGAIGQPTKAPAAAGQVADGYYPDILVAPQIWNYERWAEMAKAQEASSTRVLNWIASDLTAAGLTGTLRGGGMFYATPGNLHYSIFTSHNAVPAPTEAVSGGGLIYAAGVPIAACPAGARLRIVTDQVGMAVTVQSALVAYVAYYRIGLGAWAVPAQWNIPPSVAGTWGPFDHDWLGLWNCLDTGGGGGAASTTGAGVAWAAVVNPPGFAGAPVVLKHSHHPAGLIYPQDPGNQVWLGISNGPMQWSRSLNGANYTVAAATGVAGNCEGLAYSAAGTRWGMCLSTTNWAYSDDNGTTWTTAAVPLPGLGAITQSEIACDGFGDWAIAATDGTNVRACVSWDNGTTWTPLFFPVAPGAVNMAMWYGGGRFHLMTDDGAGNFVGYTSFRGGGV